VAKPAFVRDSSESLSIGQVSARTGLSVHALRFYEREGVLVASVARRAGTEEDRLSILCQYQECLFAQVRELNGCLDLVTHKIAVYKDILG
jgi:hypothetical protein